MQTLTESILVVKDRSIVRLIVCSIDLPIAASFSPRLIGTTGTFLVGP
jgi:hypothetical protein